MVEQVQWSFDVLDTEDPSSELCHLAEFLDNKRFDMIINLPMHGAGGRKVASFMTHGYRTRRLAVDYSIPLVTDVKCAKLLVESMRRTGCHPAMKTHVDCMTSRRMAILPGFIDVHVHLRDPGATHKEDFSSGTAAALAGGVTMVCAMPNTTPSIVDRTTFTQFQELAMAKAHCDYALYVGASDSNWSSVHEMAKEAAGLKMYLNDTFSTLKMSDMTVWEKHMQNWPKRAPIVCHAERQTMAAVILMAQFEDRPVHICHIARKEEIMIIRAAKEKGVRVTCEVCPHHLFLSTDNVSDLGEGVAQVRPVLCSKEDQQALWDNMQYIDVFATDHAPHTWQEKSSENPPPGFPGVETILPLLLNAVDEGRLTMEDLCQKFYHNPRRIFNLPEQPNTYVEVDLDEEWIISKKNMHSRAQWTPFEGMKVKGKVHRVILRSEVAYIDGEVVVSPGYGLNVRGKYPRVQPTPVHVPPVSEDVANLSAEVANLTVKPMLDRSLDLVSDALTNETFSKLLSEPLAIPKANVHFAGEPNLLRPISPLPRLRCDSASNTTLKELLNKNSLASAAAISPVTASLLGKHVLSVDMFSKDKLTEIFNLTQMLKSRVTKGRPVDELLRGKIMASVFFEVSTRTSCSFAAAMQRLGGRVIYMNETNSSAKKGESLEDSISVMAGYSDVVVLRHPEPGAVARAAHHCRKPIINAGDGIGEHPTQALLDVFTIREEIGTVNGLTITMVGDLKHGRTVHSLARLLTLYNVTLQYVSPEGLGMPDKLVQYLNSKGVSQKVMMSLEEALPNTDVIYMTRIQQERFSSEAEYQKCCGKFVVTPKLMTRASRRTIVMHPLPRVFEISPEFDSDPRAAYFRQAEYGMYIRMALLAMVVGCRN